MTAPDTVNGIPLDLARSLTESKIAFVERMGLRAEILEPGHVRLRAPLAGNENHIGTMYAGALFTLAEIPGGALAITTFDITRYYPLVKEMTVRFLRPATTDVTVELRIGPDEVERIQQDADRSGRGVFVLECELKDATGQVVMTSHGDYQLRAWPQPQTI